MRLTEAIALSTSNKAEADNDEGKTIVVQARYAGMTDSWYHIWLIDRDNVSETDETSLGILHNFGVDPEAKYWQRIGK